MNPFFVAWTTPFGVPPFDAIRAEHYGPAFDRAMAEADADIAAITGNGEPPDFANTIEALERAGKRLNVVAGVFYNLSASMGGADLERIDLEYAPKLAAHGSRIMLDPKLFARVDALFRQRALLGLEADQLRLLERTHLGFVRAGAALDEAARGRLGEISEQLASLHAQFGQNVVHDEREWSLQLEGDDLAGLPDFVVDGARQAAAERGLEGHVVTLSRSLIESFLTYAARRDLRQAAYLAWVARGTHPGAHDNRALIPQILALRAERARLLGYGTYAEYRLADTMAGSVEAVSGFTTALWRAAVKRAEQERDALFARAGADGVSDRLEGWDWRYYAEQQRLAEFDLDEAALKPYFLLENIQAAAFDTAARLFGLGFTECTDVLVYHPDVRVYEVRDAEGHVGVFIADPFARPDKRSGAWMSTFRDQSTLDGRVSPVVINNNNFVKSSPALLGYMDARTLFHEFGHALHALLSQVRYPSQSGTAVLHDFVEFPSQVMEHWIGTPEVLRRFARHHETGAPIPEALIAKLKAAQTFNQGFVTVETLASTILDMELHALRDPAELDVMAFERDVMARLGAPVEIGARHRPPHFQHIFSGGGYAAGYYAYLWASVLDADGFAAFEEAGDPFAPGPAAGLKRILRSGDSEDPMALYVAFRGAKPGTEALMRERGLVA